MPDTPRQSPPDDAILRTLARQEELYLLLEALGQRQSGLIDHDEPDLLLSVLAERQRVVDEIGRASRELAPLRSAWTSVVASMPEASRVAVHRRVESVSAIARRVAERDESDRLRLEARRDSLSRELASLNRGGGAAQAYGAPAPATPRFADREA